jgi:hypothetical protein
LIPAVGLYFTTGVGAATGSCAFPLRAGAVLPADFVFFAAGDFAGFFALAIGEVFEIVLCRLHRKGSRQKLGAS